jgi:hypothetical protein
VNSSDLRIYVEAVGLATFPDGSVICGPLQQHPPSPDATALNPLILLEVTSDSSEEYDTNGKLEAYKTIPTLREVLLVSHRERRITLHRREADGTWVMRVAIAGGASPSSRSVRSWPSIRSTGTRRLRDDVHQPESDEVRMRSHISHHYLGAFCLVARGSRDTLSQTSGMADVLRVIPGDTSTGSKGIIGSCRRILYVAL